MKLPFDTAAYDGGHRLSVAIEPPAGATDGFSANNAREQWINVAMDRARWAKTPLCTGEITTAGGRDVSLAITLPAGATPSSVRVVDQADKSVPAQFEPDEPGGRVGRLAIALPESTPAGWQVQVLAAPLSAATGVVYWDANE